MKDFDEFLEWYDVNCSGDFDEEFDRIKYTAKSGDLLSTVYAASDMEIARTTFLLRKYHECLSSQI